MNNLTHGEQARIRRERHRSMVNRKYRMDLYWILLATMFFSMGIFFSTVYAPFIDHAKPLHITLAVGAACIIVTMALKFIERKVF